MAPQLSSTSPHSVLEITGLGCTAPSMLWASRGETRQLLQVQDSLRTILWRDDFPIPFPLQNPSYMCTGENKSLGHEQLRGDNMSHTSCLKDVWVEGCHLGGLSAHCMYMSSPRRAWPSPHGLAVCTLYNRVTIQPQARAKGQNSLSWAASLCFLFYGCLWWQSATQEQF